jgi:hypothetical protein
VRSGVVVERHIQQAPEDAKDEQKNHRKKHDGNSGTSRKGCQQMELAKRRRMKK